MNIMKKIYIIPKIESYVISAPTLMSTSNIQDGGDDSGDGIAESKDFQGSLLDEDDAYWE